MKDLLTVDELSKVLKISTSTIYRWVHYGFIPHYKLAVRFRKKEVGKWLEKEKSREEHI